MLGNSNKKINVEMNQNYDALHLFKALRLFFLPNFPGPTFIPCPRSIPDSRVGAFGIIPL